MTRTPLNEVTCSIARSVDILGDAWAWLILRDVYAGIRRFDLLEQDLGLSRKVLSRRLQELCAAELLVRQRYARLPDRFEYVLTDKGSDLMPVIFALVAWGDRWTAGVAGPPVELVHADCGSVSARVDCDNCGQPLNPDEVTLRPGPGGSLGHGTAVLGALLTGRFPATD